MPAGAPPVLTPAALRSATPSIQMSQDNLKAAGICAATGTIATAPVKAASYVGAASKAGKAAVTLSTSSLAAQLAVFGILYRFTCRSDANDFTKQSVVGMFSLFRACSMVQVKQMANDHNPDSWLFLAYFGESCLAFATAASCLEYAIDRGWVSEM